MQPCGVFAATGNAHSSSPLPVLLRRCATWLSRGAAADWGCGAVGILQRTCCSSDRQCIPLVGGLFVRELFFSSRADQMPDLIVDHVAKEYPTRAEALRVLTDICLELSTGENLAVLGPSGSGKSTLLYVIGTLDPPSAGSVSIGGQDPYALSEPELARFRNQHIGFIFQGHHLLPQLSVLENVLVPALAMGKITRELDQRAHELLERVGLEARLEHRPAELSGGERGRVAVARALITNPKLILADEPTGNLDQTTARSVAQLLLKLQQEEETMLIVVTHSTDLADLLQHRRHLDNGTLGPVS